MMISYHFAREAITVKSDKNPCVEQTLGLDLLPASAVLARDTMTSLTVVPNLVSIPVSGCYWVIGRLVLLVLAERSLLYFIYMIL